MARGRWQGLNFCPEVKRRNFNLDRERREQQKFGAQQFLFLGESEIDPPYGTGWDREYNPSPYPDAKPDPEMYDGTGVGHLYGLDSSTNRRNFSYFNLLMAGWNLTRDHPEVRRKVDKVKPWELIHPSLREEK